MTRCYFNWGTEGKVSPRGAHCQVKHKGVNVFCLLILHVTTIINLQVRFIAAQRRSSTKDKTFEEEYNKQLKQGKNRARFNSIAEWDVRLIHCLCQTTEAQNLNAFFHDAVRNKEAMRSEIKSDGMSRTFLNKRVFFLRVAGCEFIQMNRRSASFEC